MMEAKQKRRSRGLGCVFQRDGRWHGVVSVGLNASGKRIQRWVAGKTKRDVEDEILKLRNQKRNGSLVGNTKTTVAEWIRHWLENIAPHAARPCRQTTIYRNEKTARCYINPFVGGKALSKLTPADVQFMHGELRRAGLKPATVALAHRVLSRALEVAIEQNLLAVNPCRKAGRPGIPDEEMKVLTPEQAGAFLKAAEGDRLHALYVLAITGGLRQGELFGLKRDDIDLNAGAVAIRRTLVRVKGDVFENSPKSKRGNRTVQLAAVAVNALRDHYRRMLIEGNAGSTYVFCTTLGTPLLGTNVTRKSFHPLLEAAGLPRIRFHDLRHTSATMLLASGENAKVVMQRLGHANVSITLGTYSHVLPGMDAAAAAKFDTMLAAGAG